MNFQLIQTNDTFEIKILLSIDDLYQTVIGCKNLAHWTPDFIHTDWFMIEVNDEIIGILQIRDFTDNCISFHGGLKKKARGQDTLLKFDEMIRHIKILYPNYALFTHVDSSNREVRALLNKTTFKHKMTVPHGYSTGDLMIYAEG